MNDTLTELLPRKVRLWLYVIASLTSVGVAAWNAANGDWNVFIGSVAAALVTALAARNTPSPPPVAPAPEPEPLEPQASPTPLEQPPARRWDEVA